MLRNRLYLAGIGAMSDTYNAIVDRLTELMTDLPAAQAALLAEDLTARINSRISSCALGRALEPCEECFGALPQGLPAHLMNFATLDAPWAAYRRVHGVRSTKYPSEATVTRLICSVPESMAHVARPTYGTSLWSGSLLDALGLVLNNAKAEVLIMNPYWSLLGVKSLLRRITRQSYAGVQVLIMTQPRSRLEPAMRDGIDLFVSTLETMGATCQVLAPALAIKPLPLLHGKTVVADRNYGYIGSANLTGNGMDFSVEIGMAFSGILARQLADWMAALKPALDDWCK